MQRLELQTNIGVITLIPNYNHGSNNYSDGYLNCMLFEVRY